MNPSDEQVELLLEASAENWRSSLPASPERDVAALVRGHPRHAAWPFSAAAGLAAVVVSVTVLALIVGSLYGAFGSARPSPLSSALAPTSSMTPSSTDSRGSASVGPQNSCACTEPPPTPPPGGISQQEAEQRALALVPASGKSSLHVVWSGFEFDPFVAWNAPNRKPVWTVRIEGAIAAPTCVPGYFNQHESTSDPMCTDNEGGVDVVLDFYDGSLIGFRH